MAAERERDKFGTEELGLCLSHFDLGIITSIEEFARGSRRAPKLVICSERGKFLLKRRAQNKSDLTRVAFAHEVQLALAGQNFPLPHLHGTRDSNNSMLVMDPDIYELFEFVEGGPHDGSPEATTSAGRILGLYHKLLAGFRGRYSPPVGSYHDAQSVRQAILNTVGSLPMDSRPPADVLASTVGALERSYAECTRQADELGLAGWPKQIVHGDWHPGNMLFRDGRVVAVLDYDAARLQQRVIDLANGALQYSILGGGDDPTKWPDRLDEKRFKCFLTGYDQANVISKLELRALPYLMCEAMIAEAVLPIAATGSFGRIPGFAFLQMVEKKVRWILGNAGDMCDSLVA